jgi:hypothetical protein
VLFGKKVGILIAFGDMGILPFIWVVEGKMNGIGRGKLDNAFLILLTNLKL